MESHPPMLPQAPAPPPTSPPSGDDNLWIIFSHLSLLLGVGLVVPLIIYLVKKDESERIAHHAREALNFHISIVIYSFACAITCIGIPLVFVITIGGIVYGIIAATRASDPVPYRYPLTLRLVT
ncbi:MAG: DUF4870 domain-containing protein [Luteolibacter sp.]